MIGYRTNKIAEPKKILIIKKKLDKIGNKYKKQISGEINDFAKKIGFPLALNVIMDLKLLGKTKGEVKPIG